MIDADLTFHRAIYEAAGNVLLVQSAERHWSHIRRIMGATLSQVGARAAIWDEHERMLAAIASGDDVSAQQLALHHCEKAGDTLVARVSALVQTNSQSDAQTSKRQTNQNSSINNRRQA